MKMITENQITVQSTTRAFNICSNGLIFLAKQTSCHCQVPKTHLKKSSKGQKSTIRPNTTAVTQTSLAKHWQNNAKVNRAIKQLIF